MLKLKPIEIDREPILQLAEQNLQQGNDEMAIRYYQQFLSIKKPHKHKYLVYYNLGRIWLRRNTLDEGFNFLHTLKVLEKCDKTPSKIKSKQMVIFF